MNQPPQPGYQQHPGYSQEPRRGKPWWVWLLGGCAGCAVIVILGMVIVGVVATNAVKSVAKGVGPVTMASVQQNLGEVPTYPGATLDEKATQAVLVPYRLIEQTMGKESGSVFRAVGAMYTADSPEKVLKFYKTKLEADGWKQVQSTNTGFSEQQHYQKGGDMVIIQAQSAGSKRTMVMLIRGGPEIAKSVKSQPLPSQ